MPFKALKIDFYRVLVDDDATKSFANLIDQVGNTPDDEGRAQSRNDDAVRLQSAGRVRGFCRGEMLRIRMNETPVKAKLNGWTADIDLENDEGLGEEMAFVYHPATRILAIQRNRLAVSASGCVKYFALQTGTPKIDLEPILKLDALQRLAQMHTVRTFEVHLAGVASGSPLERGGHSARRMFSMLDDFQAPNATIRLSMGRQPGTLHNVVEAARDLLRGTGDREVTKILAIGTDGSADETEVIDLLADRLSEDVIVEIREGRRITSQHRFDALHEAWNRNDTYFRSHYSSER